MNITYGDIAVIRKLADVVSETVTADTSQPNLEKYIAMFNNLNRNKSKGYLAPHKPIMLLAVIENVRNGANYKEGIIYDRELENKFNELWGEYVPEDFPFKPNAKTPFTYLNGEPFWNLTSVVTAKMDNELLQLISDKETCGILEKELLEIIQHRSTPPPSIKLDVMIPFTLSLCLSLCV